MSATIRNTHGNRVVVIEKGIFEDEVFVSVRDEGAHVTRTDLLAALRAEGILPAEVEPLAEWEFELTYPGQKLVPADAIVILRETLPEVEPTEPGAIIDGEHFVGRVAEQDRRWARSFLAYAEYLDANPPVDPQVAALSAVLRDFAIFDHGGGRDDDVLALRLFERGVRIEAAK